MSWIRVSLGIGDDPRVHSLAERLGVRVAEAVGCAVALLCKFPEHAPGGSVAATPDSLLEKWALWEGRRGRFASEFRSLFLDEGGTWRAWEKHNGAALREREADKKRAAERRRAINQAAQTTLDLAQRPAESPADGPTERPPLRTDERTKSSYAHARGNGNGTRYPAGDDKPTRPHLPAVATAPPWCTECGPGELVEREGQRRPVRVHLATCSQHVAPLTLVAERTA